MRALSNGLTFLKLNRLLVRKSYFIFWFYHSTNSLQQKLAFSIRPAEKQTGTSFYVLFQYVQSRTDNYCALPSAKTGISTFPPFSTVYETILSIFLYRSLLVSLIVVAYVVYVMMIFGLSLGAYAAPRCRSAYELQSPVYMTDNPSY